MRRIIPLLFMVFILWSCTPARVGGVLEKITPPASPSKGMATVIGQVIDKKNGEPLADVTIRLAEVFREGEGGTFVVNMASSPGTRSDAQGYFIIENITPREYVVAVGEGENMANYDVIEENTGKAAKVWMAESDKITDLGVIQVEVKFR